MWACLFVFAEGWFSHAHNQVSFFFDFFQYNPDARFCSRISREDISVPLPCWCGKVWFDLWFQDILKSSSYIITQIFLSISGEMLNAHLLFLVFKMLHLCCLGNEIWWSPFMGCWTFHAHSWSYLCWRRQYWCWCRVDEDEDSCPLPSDLLWREPLFDQMIANRYKAGEVRNY
jgi:hypothetical protein